MTSTQWQRSWFNSQDWQRGWQLIGFVEPSSTLLRTRFAWYYAGTTRVEESWLRMSLQGFTMGVCTVVGLGGETPPAPRDHPEDHHPPLERWIYWEGRQTLLKAVDPTKTICYWESSIPQEPVDSKAMVSAKPSEIPEGQALNVFASWEAFENWPTSGVAHVYGWAGCLIQSP